MDYTLNITKDWTDTDVLRLKTAIRELADDLDVLYTETSPDGSVSARIGRIAIYNSGSGYEMWQNIDGATSWQRISSYDDSVLLTGDQTIAGVKTFSSAPVLSNGADANKKAITNLVIENRTDDPSSPVAGQIWYRTDLD